MDPNMVFCRSWSSGEELGEGQGGFLLPMGHSPRSPGGKRIPSTASLWWPRDLWGGHTHHPRILLRKTPLSKPIWTGEPQAPHAPSEDLGWKRVCGVWIHHPKVRGSCGEHHPTMMSARPFFPIKPQLQKWGKQRNCWIFYIFLFSHFLPQI